MEYKYKLVNNKKKMYEQKHICKTNLFMSLRPFACQHTCHCKAWPINKRVYKVEFLVVKSVNYTQKVTEIIWFNQSYHAWMDSTEQLNIFFFIPTFIKTISIRNWAICCTFKSQLRSSPIIIFKVLPSKFKRLKH